MTASGTSLVGARILVAEDSGVEAEVTRRALVEAGCHVRLERDGLAAIAALGEEEFDLLVTDWTMPQADGIEVCRTVRSREELAGLYVLFLTSRVEKAQVVEALSAGADDYLCKPFDPGELLARVRAGYRLVELQWQLRAANEKLEHQAMTDALTDLANRRAFDRMLVREVATYERGAPPFCLVRIDLDHFKEVNDVHGHDAGDLLLASVANAMRVASRAADVPARIGGDEFALLLRNCELDEAFHVCERVRTEIETVEMGSGLSATASIGFAQIEPTRDAEETLARADEALYAAKRAGGNCVVAAGEAQPASP